jgi:hypothetical protein
MALLTLTPSDWYAGLDRSGQQLRHAWTHGWPGLPSVLGECLDSLGLRHSGDGDIAAMNRFGLAVAQDMESLAQSRPADAEPAYHNRLHTADVLVALTTLLHTQGAAADTHAHPWAAMLLATAVAHDCDHPGGVNRSPFEIERHSWTAVAPRAQGLPEVWRQCMEQLILRTDIQAVPLNHERVSEQAFAWDDQEAAEMFFQSLPDSHDLSQTTYPEYIQERLYEKGIGSIRKQMAHISRGIQSVIPQAALELFTDQEFETMINGVNELPGDTLWNGIHFKLNGRETYIKQWLDEIIHEENVAFRFAFNRFITGATHPPVNINDPWIFVEVNFLATLDSLPTAQTCFRNILIPNYSSKEMLHQKLALAVLNGVSNMDLY